ncbi:MAG: hypothetical protein HQK83_19125, partial [Fibrobacteria bacterium]|nr:hypothetical protein [Fibrobacteria bacterium]
MKTLWNFKKSLFFILLGAQVLLAGHPAGKLFMVELSHIGNLSSTEPAAETVLPLDEFINDGFNGVLIRRWTGDMDAVHQSEFVEEMQEAGLWLAASDIAGSYDEDAAEIKRMANWGIDFVEIDEPFQGGSGGCHARHWLETEADYLRLRGEISSDMPLLITDVFCNDKIWNWNIDGLVQEVYGTNFYPSYLNKVVSWSNGSGKPGYVYINAYNRQLYNKCEVQTEDMNKTWSQAAWDKNIKIILFSFATRCADCMTWGDCTSEPYNMVYGNNWPSWQRTARSITAGHRVKFH